MMKDVKQYIGKGITSDEFIQRMTKNKEAFSDWRAKFSWANEADQSFFQALSTQENVRCLIIAAEWCGDVVRNVPVVLRVLEQTGWPVEMFVMEEHLDFIDQFLTMGGRSIPVVLFVSSNGQVLAQWGPRPQRIQEVMVAFKRDNPDRQALDYDENLKIARQELMARYGTDTAYQAEIVAELRTLLSPLQA